MYGYDSYPSIDDVDPDDWDRLRHPDKDPFMDRRYIRAVERSMSDRVKFRHVVIRDADRRPVAIACLHAWLLDLRLVFNGWGGRAIDLARRAAPRLGRRKIVCCGLPIGAGHSSVRIAAKADAEEVLRVLNGVLHRIAKQEGARWVVLSEFTADESARLAPLEGLGYLRASSRAMNLGPAPFRDFDDFCSSLHSRKRSVVRRSRKKFARSGLRVAHLRGSDGVAELYSDEVHRLFLEVAQPKKRTHDVPAAFFRELAVQMPEETVFTLIYDGARVAAFAASLCTGKWYQQLYVGFDHKLNPECDLYFNLFFNAVDYALRQNVHELLLGQNSDTFKQQKLAAFQQPRYVYVKGLGAVRNAVSRYALKRILARNGHS